MPKWTKARRAKFAATMRRKRKYNHPTEAPTDVELPVGTFFEIRDGKPYPVSVKRITMLVIS